ncbi:archaetidylserine decarboxylase [soil metagenome]
MSETEVPNPPPRSWRALLGLLGRLPQGALSRGFGRLADAPIPRPLREPLLGAFARGVGASVQEAELPLSAYPTLNRFFTRKLRPGARVWPADPNLVACPVDGATGQVGTVREGRLIQAKGRDYTVSELLDDAPEAERFEGGAFVTLYLSPRDYHRIHTPCDGAISRARHIPGALLPVNKAAVSHLPQLFARNERLLCYIDGPLGRVAMVAVGAYNVGRISAAWDPVWNAPAGADSWVTNRPGLDAATRVYDPPPRLRQGDELMIFHMGSSVVMLFEPGRVKLRPDLQPDKSVRAGEVLGVQKALPGN